MINTNKARELGKNGIGVPDLVEAAALLLQLAEAHDSMAKDAARYRWLRDHGGATYQTTATQPTGMKAAIFMRLPSMNASGTFMLKGDYADSIVDNDIAAMGADNG